MTSPRPDDIEGVTGFTGHQKDFIRAYANWAASQAVAQLRAELVQLIGDANTPTSSDSVLETLKSRVDAVEARYNEDDKYTLTPAKLRMMMQKMGIE